MDGRLRGRGWSGMVVVLVAALVLVPLPAGCARADDPGDPGVAGDPAAAAEAHDGSARGGPAADGPAADRAGPDRPAEKRIMVEVEGMAEEMRVALYRSPAGFPLPFSTYVPGDMIAEPVPAGEADGVRFVADFGGHRNDAVAVRLLVAGAGGTEAELVAVLRELARELGTELVEEPGSSFAWSAREFRNVAPGSRHAAAEGIMAIGRRDGRSFALALHHPAEYGDGFAPRARVILDEWRWADTGARLGS